MVHNKLFCIFEVGQSELETFMSIIFMFMREYFFEFHDASSFENGEIMAQWNKMN